MYPSVAVSIPKSRTGLERVTGFLPDALDRTADLSRYFGDLGGELGLPLRGEAVGGRGDADGSDHRSFLVANGRGEAADAFHKFGVVCSVAARANFDAGFGKFGHRL